VSYSQPEAAEKFTPSDHPEWLGKLFLVHPTYVEDVQFKPDEAPTKIVTADIAIVDLIDPRTGSAVILRGVSIGGKLLAPVLAKYIGQDDPLGRLYQKPRQGEKSGAYFLDNFTPADVEQAIAFEKANPTWRGGYAQPVATAVPPSAVQMPPASAAAAPVAAANGAVPWFHDPANAVLVGKLSTSGVANWTALDLTTAQMIGNGLP
jgi:hypothetical protein